MIEQTPQMPGPIDELDSETRLLTQVLEALDFHRDRYLDENPDLKIYQGNLRGLVLHYLQHGHREGRQLRFRNPMTGSRFIREMIQSVDLRPDFRSILEFIEKARRAQSDPIAQTSRLLEVVGEMPIFVTIDHFEGPKFGDSLTAIPWMIELSMIFRRRIYVGGLFHPSIRPLVSALALRFDEPPSPGPTIKFSADVQKAFDTAGLQHLHFAQSYFRLAGMPVPPVPLTIPFDTTPTGLPPGFCIHPFTASDDGKHNKLWWPDRWQVIIRYLLERFGTVPIYIFGGKKDDVSPYLLADSVTAILDRPLKEVLDIILHCRFFISLDSGLSHLAHFAGVTRHLILYPEVVGPSVSVNPNGYMIRGVPERIEATQVIDVLNRVLV